MSQKILLITEDNFHAQCDRLAKKEKVFKSILSQYAYPPFWKRPANFQTLIHIILEQQVSLASAQAALNKLLDKLGTIDPARLMQLTDEELKACYFSRQKMLYARHLAECIVSGSLALETLQHLPDEVIDQQLQQVKGIGSWSSDVFMMMGLQRADRFPINDIALRNSMKDAFELPIATSAEALLQMAEKWRPHRTVAAFMLWHLYLSKRKR